MAVGRPVDNGRGGRGHAERPLPKRFEEALRKPHVMIEELAAKYLNVAIGRIEPETPEYESFTGDCYLLNVLDSEEADDLLASWFIRADEDEEPLEADWKNRGIYPSLQILTLIRRPRPGVLDRMLVRAGDSTDGLKLYSWASHLARKFQGDRNALEKLDAQIEAWDGRAAGRYRSLKAAVMYGPWGPKGPPDSRGLR